MSIIIAILIAWNAVLTAFVIIHEVGLGFIYKLHGKGNTESQEEQSPS